MNEIVQLSACDLAQEIKAGRLSAREAVDAYIEQVEAVNPQLNALVIPLFDQARQEAQKADERQAQGMALGPLHGVPVTIKEQYRVAGTQTTLGALSKVGNVYQEEGALVRALREAGAIILGKTNIIQTLSGFESDNRVYGRSNNPWNLERTPGGSSGGEAAIVSAYGSAIGLAGDMAGSTRIPAHFCGVHGLKPTTGRLTNEDFAPGLLGYGMEVFAAQPGPIARTVKDVALAMEVWAATSQSFTYDVVPPVPWPDYQKVDVGKLRVGFFTDNGYLSPAPAMRRLVKEAVEALSKMGAQVVEVEPPDARKAMAIFLQATSAGGSGDFRKLLGKEKPIPQIAGMLKGMEIPPFVKGFVAKMMKLQGQEYLSEQISFGGPKPTADYFKVVEARTDLRAKFARTMYDEKLDAIVCPAFPVPAVLHGTSQNLFPALSYTFVYNIIGVPAGVVAAGKVRPDEESDRPESKDLTIKTARQVEQNSAGLPVGVQVVGRHWREDVVLAVMAALEDYFRTTQDYPKIPTILEQA